MSQVSVIKVVPGGTGGSGDSEEGGGAGNSEGGGAVMRSKNDRESPLKGSRRKIRLRNPIRGQ